MKIGPVPPLGKFMDPFKGFWANARFAEDIPGNLMLSGLEEPVKIHYDDMLVPHIFAKNENDLFYTTGYVHAFHRLWQMEFQTHAAAGRLSEIAGEITLDMDRRMRRIGMVYGAENFIRGLDDETRLIFEQYSEGINQRISELDYSDYPFEYKLLDYKPEQWSVLKIGLLYKYMSDMLNSGEKDLENTNFLNKYGREMLDLIYPDVDNYSDPVVENNGNWGFDTMARSTSETQSSKPDVVSITPLEAHNPNNGSNNWAVGPDKSTTGNPILCNDMHLSLYMPSLWFYQHLHADDINVFGHCTSWDSLCDHRL